jgi:hypothetical protein
MAEVGVDLSKASTSRLTPELAQRAQLLITMGCGDQCPVIPGLKRDESHELTPDGLKVAFSADGETLATIARVVDAERQCCRFLRFVITVAPEGGPLTLELSGPGGTREFLAGLLEL